MFGSQITRVAPGAFFVTGHCQNCCAHCEHARRFGASHAYVAEHRQGIGGSAQAKSRQPERCPS